MIRSLLVLALCCASTCSHAETFTVPELGLSFDAPAGFKPVPADVVAVKWRQSPGFVVGNERASTTIAADLRPNAVRPEQLPQLEKALEAQMPQLMPDLRWVRHEIVTIQGRRWAVLELTSQVQDTGIHNIVLATSSQGKLLLVNFNSTIGDFPQVEAALRQSIQSVRVAKP